MKTSDLTGPALDWAVAKAEGDKVFRPRVGRPDDWDKAAYLEDGSDDRWVVRAQPPNVGWFSDYTYNPSTFWLLGGPIIERECVELVPDGCGGWIAALRGGDADDMARGPTPLIAAMRCFVASRLGDEVDIPEELSS